MPPAFYKKIAAFIFCLLCGHGNALAQTNIVAGQGRIVHADITHPNGNTYDQLLITGQSLTVTADEGQSVRVSFIDTTDDIIQCEFSGSGTMRIDFAPETFSAPAPPINYNQPDVLYAKGHASITLEGTNAFSSFAIYAVGAATSSFAALFKDDVAYDGLADISVLRIIGSDMSSIFAGNARFTANSGSAGIDAPGTKFHGRLIIHDIEASGTAQALLRVANNSPLTLDSGAVLIAAGDLHQNNSLPIDVRDASGTALLTLKSVGAIRSTGETIAIQPISRMNEWLVGKGTVSANSELIISLGLPTYPSQASQLAQYRNNPFQISDADDGFHFDESTEEWQYEEIQHHEGIEASMTYKGSYAYEQRNNGTGFNIVLDYEVQAVSLNGFTKLTPISEQTTPPLPKTAVISARSNGSYEYLLTLTDGTEKSETGSYDTLNTIRLPGLE